MFGIDMIFIMILITYIAGLVCGVSLARPRAMRHYRPRYEYEDEWN
jgi:hypothetical protein